MAVSSFIEHVKALSGYRNQIVHIEHLPPRKAIHREPAKPLDSRLEAALRSSGLYPLYTHQASAIDLLMSGENVAIVTGAASGKTLCYHLPVLQSILADRTSRALYVFPTKALAQDQLRNLRELASLLDTPVRLATFDGDTPREERSYAKKSAQIVFTNPDMLHLGILPNHQSWARFLRRLRYVVIDEFHLYRGIFGSHVGNVIRRLRRLLDNYGAHPQFICCSATIANAKEHVERLSGLPFKIVDADGAPRSRKDFVLWNPPPADRAKGSRISANSEAAFLLAELVQQQIHTIVFAHTRKLTELIYIYAKQRLHGSSMVERIKPYRGGYLPEERRQIEKELFDGELLGVVTTTALELGIDIGDLEAAVLTGYPGSIASMWQQAGRSGRRTGMSLSFLIGRDNPLDQYFMRHPEALFGKRYESALTDPFNRYVLESHLLCAAWELPLRISDDRYWGEDLLKTCQRLEESRLLRPREGRWYPTPSIAYPAEQVNIRSASSFHYVILDVSQGNRQIETVDASVALSQIHPGAVYLHLGESYLVTELDLTGRCAYAVPADVPYYTQAKELTEIRVVKKIKEKRILQSTCYLGEVEVTTTVVGFRRKMQFTEEVLSEEFLDLPPDSFNTVAIWFDIPQEAIDRITGAQLDFAGGLHAAEHAAISMMPLFALCDRNDLGGVSTPFHPDTGKPQIFIYDAHPGSTGIAEKGFEVIHHLWQETLRVIQECPCEDGCPSCVQSPKCGNNNQPLDKKAARVILEVLVQPAGKGD